MKKPSRGSDSINRIPVGGAADPCSWPEVEDIALILLSGVSAGIIDFESPTMLPGLAILFQAADKSSTQWNRIPNIPLRTI
jgi:hypothetical protein